MSHKTKSIQIKGKAFMKYSDFLKQSGLSAHPNHLARRQMKYPQEFTYVEDMPFISVTLVDRLTQCHIAFAAIQSINN